MRRQPSSDTNRNPNVATSPNIKHSLRRTDDSEQVAAFNSVASQPRSAVNTPTASLFIRIESIFKTFTYDSEVNTIHLQPSLQGPVQLSELWYGLSCPSLRCTTSHRGDSLCLEHPNPADTQEEENPETVHITIDLDELRVRTRDQRFEYLHSTLGLMIWDRELDQKLEDVFRDAMLLLEGVLGKGWKGEPTVEFKGGLQRYKIGRVGDVIRECEILREEMKAKAWMKEEEEEEEFAGFEECQRILEEAVDAFNRVVESTVKIISPPSPNLSSGVRALIEDEAAYTDDEEMDDLLSDWSIDFESVERGLRAATFSEAFNTYLGQLDRLIQAFHRLIDYVASLGGRFGDLEVESLKQSVKLYEELRRQPGFEMDALTEGMKEYQRVLEWLSWGQSGASPAEGQKSDDQKEVQTEESMTTPAVFEKPLREGWGEAELCWYRYSPQDLSYDGFVLDLAEPVNELNGGEEVAPALCEDPAVLGVIEAVVDRGTWPESVDSGFESDGSVRSDLERTAVVRRRSRCRSL